MKARGILLLILLAALMLPTPLAYASPPDAVWVNGFFDNADFDDVVVFLTVRRSRP